MVELRSRISGDMAVGTLIDGVVAGKVAAKKEGLLVPAGSPVRGRIRRLERYTDPFPYFVVALEFTELELQGIRHRFFADVVKIESAPGVEQSLVYNSAIRVNNAPAKQPSIALPDTSKPAGELVNREDMQVKRHRETLWLHTLPGVATFFFKSGNLDLEPGFQIVWETRPLVPGKHRQE